MGLKAVVRTPGVEGEEMEIEEIELPPREMWEHLDNSRLGKTAEEAAPAPEAVAPSVPAAGAEVAVLQFVSRASTTVKLSFPFIWEGKEVAEIPVRRLTVGEVDELAQQTDGERTVLFDIYARMTGFPAAVLRGLDDDDGRALSVVCYGFLPRSLRTGDG